MCHLHRSHALSSLYGINEVNVNEVLNESLNHGPCVQIVRASKLRHILRELVSPGDVGAPHLLRRTSLPLQTFSLQ